MDSLDFVNLLAINFALFLLSIYGIVNGRRSLILILISIEILLLSTSLNFIFFSIYLDDLLGQIFALFILTVAASESAIGLALLVVYYRLRGTIDLNSLTQLKG